jgi:calcineurin-like phosphoesterase family protein
MKTFATSDNHFWHNNVIKYCNRPFRSVEEMNEAMVVAWNAVVNPEDTVLHFGDFSMAFRAVELFSHRLNGNKILIPGNHDFCHSYHKKSRTPEGRILWTQKYVDHGWTVLDERVYGAEIDGVKFNLCHHPYADGSGADEGDPYDKYENWRPIDDGTVLLCGHVHEKWKTKRSPLGTLQINVGVDVWGMAPVSFDTIKQLIETENGKKT